MSGGGQQQHLTGSRQLLPASEHTGCCVRALALSTRAAAGQYYNLIRLGREGYTDIMHAIQANAAFIRQRLVDSGWFQDVAKAPGVPVVCLKLKNRPEAAGGETSGSGSGGTGKPLLFTVYEVSERLRGHGWIVPASDVDRNALGGCRRASVTML